MGAAVTTQASARRLTAISGFDKYPGVPFEEADYTLVEDFDALAAALRQIAIELCQASVTVPKLVDEGDGEYRADPGREFTASVATKPGGYTWTQPAPPPATGAADGDHQRRRRGDLPVEALQCGRDEHREPRRGPAIRLRVR